MKHRSEKLSDDEKNLAAGKKLMFEEEGSSIKFTEKIFFLGPQNGSCPNNFVNFCAI